MKLRPPFKIHGGKRYLADWIISHLPNDYTEAAYIEPFCGAANVLLRKKPSPFEVINDIDEGIYAILTALRDTPYELQARLESIPYCEDVFQQAKTRNGSDFNRDIDFAINEFIVRRMSRGGLKEAFAWSDRQRGGQPGDVNAWKTIIEQLPTISERLQNVRIFKEDVLAEEEEELNFLNRWADNSAVIYCDPPYVQQTRQSQNVYEDEMTNDNHRALAKLFKDCGGRVIISGYPSSLYNELYSDWRVVERKIPNHSSQQKVKPYKTECLWMNYDN